VAVLLRGDHEVNEVKVKNLLGVTDLHLAGPERVEETGAEVGFAGPWVWLPLYADQAVRDPEPLVTGANRTDYHWSPGSILSGTLTSPGWPICARLRPRTPAPAAARPWKSSGASR
jgi:hypothetical protein